MLQPTWGYKDKTFDKKRTKPTGQVMRNVLIHANPDWREQRSTMTRVLDTKNQKKDKEEKRWSFAYELGQSHDKLGSL